MTDASETVVSSIDRRSLLKGAVAAGVVGATYAAPKISVVPAYGAGSLVSYTVQSGLLCAYFSPNQANFGRWYGPGGVQNNLNPNSGVVGANNSWTCWPPAIRSSVIVAGTTRYVDFIGVPDDWIGTTSGTCTSLGSTVTNYNLTNATTAWSGGGVQIVSRSSGCEINLVGTINGINLGPYCSYSSCNNSNSSGVPATWAAGSSTSPIGSPTTAGSQPNGNVGGGVFKSAYYHTGLLGRGQGDRCKFTLLFQVRCRS